MPALPLGVCVFPPPRRNVARTAQYGDYVHEILGHAGLAYASVPAAELGERLGDVRLLVTVGEGALPDDMASRLEAWLRRGGAWIAIAGVCGRPDLFGVEVEPPAFASWGGGASTLGEGYLEPPDPDDTESGPLHFFNGIAVRPVGGRVRAGVRDVHGRPTSRAGLVEHRVGEGHTLLVAPDLTGSVVRIQQGVAVTRDGVPAPDGTAPIADDVLKSGDGAVLDWTFDRQPVPGSDGLTAFLRAVADEWRRLLVRAIAAMATRVGIAVPALWCHPRGLPAVAHLSHDTDGNDPDRARALLRELARARVRSTWCVILPGYPAELLAAIRAAGHELAMHFDAVSSDGTFTEGEFDRQWRALRELFGAPPVTNKNHYLRWEGDSEFYEWCARRGIRLEQSKGASKTGEAGYNFGTCHLFHPVAPDGRPLPVWELATPTQDLVVFAPEALLDPLVATVRRHHGVLHLLYHPAHIEKPGVADSLQRAIARARAAGMEWWTGAELVAWQEARRAATWADPAGDGRRASVTLRALEPLPEATIVWLGAPVGAVRVDGDPREVTTVEAWGLACAASRVDLGAGGAARIEYERA